MSKLLADMRRFCHVFLNQLSPQNCRATDLALNNWNNRFILLKMHLNWIDSKCLLKTYHAYAWGMYVSWMFILFNDLCTVLVKLAANNSTASSWLFCTNIRRSFNVWIKLQMKCGLKMMNKFQDFFLTYFWYSMKLEIDCYQYCLKIYDLEDECVFSIRVRSFPKKSD